MPDVVAVARQFLFVREAGQNRGQRVEAIQRWSGGLPGESWCAYFATMVLDIAYRGAAPIPRMGSCEAIYQLAMGRGWVRATPTSGMLFLYVNADGNAHHVGIVTSIDPLVGIAGNTSRDGTSSDGDGVYEHPIAAHVFVDYTSAAEGVR